MRILEASQAKHIADVFWRENYNRDYKEKIMFAIEKQAEMGARVLKWRAGLSRDTQSWLFELGYAIQTVYEDKKTNTYKYIISW